MTWTIAGLSLLLGVLGSLVASTVFVWALTFLRPSFRFAPEIKHSPGQPAVIALRNATSRRCHDVHVQVYLARPVSGDRHNSTEDKLVSMIAVGEGLHLSHLGAGRLWVRKNRGLSGHIGVPFDSAVLERARAQSALIVVRVTARDDVSGHLGVTEYRYKP